MVAQRVIDNREVRKLRTNIESLVAKRERVEGCLDLLMHRASADGHFDDEERRNILACIEEEVSLLARVAQFVRDHAKPAIALNSAPIALPGPTARLR
jgi:uncharacterized membrane protein YebE (DUF533 family)